MSLIAADGSRYFRVLFQGTYKSVEVRIEFTLDQEATRVWVTWTAGVPVDDVTALLVRPVFARILWLRSITTLHASAVQVNDQAIAFVGNPGAGKSTTAALFARRGHAILTDDIAALQDLGTRFLVQPAAPAVWLWPHTAAELVESAERLPPIWTDHDKRHIELQTKLSDSPWRFQAQPLSLAAIYILGMRQRASFQPVIEPLAPAAALLTLVPNAYDASILDRARRKSQFNVFSRIVQNVPVRRVQPTEDLAALSQVYDAIMNDLALSQGASFRMPTLVA